MPRRYYGRWGMNFTDVTERIGGELKSVYGIRVKMHHPVKRSGPSSFRSSRESQVYLCVPEAFHVVASLPRDQPIVLSLPPRAFDTMQFNFNISPEAVTAGDATKNERCLEKSKADEWDTAKRREAIGKNARMNWNRQRLRKDPFRNK